MNIGVAVVIGVCILLALWYGGGYLVNRRRGWRLFLWLEEGLDVLGGKRESGWIGSPASGARITVVHAAPPFRRLEITLLLANREIPLLWLVDRLRKKQDRLIIRATLRSPQPGELEAVPARSKVIDKQDQSWARREGPHGLVVAHRGSDAGQRKLAAVEPWLEAYGAHLRRFSWRKTDPHVQLEINASGLLSLSSEALLADLQAAVGKHNAH